MMRARNTLRNGFRTDLNKVWGLVCSPLPSAREHFTKSKVGQDEGKTPDRSSVARLWYLSLEGRGSTLSRMECATYACGTQSVRPRQKLIVSRLLLGSFLIPPLA